MISIAIVEDERDYQEQLHRYILRYEQEYGERTELHFFTDGDEILDHYAAVYDIIFMDVQMRRLNGMDAARRIRKLDENVILIFITNMAQYAIQGYEVSAMNYILKPIAYFPFSQELHKAVRKLKQKDEKYIAVSQDQGLLRLNVNQISYVESFGHNLTVHSDMGDYTFRGTLKEMEEKLQGAAFVKCNSGYLVNLKYVQAVKQNAAVVGGDELPISRSRKKEFMEALTDYMGGK